MKHIRWNIMDNNGKIIEGGFFSKKVALETQKREYPNCKVVKSK